MTPLLLVVASFLWLSTYPAHAQCPGVEIIDNGVARCVKPGAGKAEWFKDCPTCPELVVIPSGSFLMGAPEAETGWHYSENVVPIKFSRPFAMSRTAVTNGDFARFVAATNYQTGDGCAAEENGAWSHEKDKNWLNPGFPYTAAHPVVCVSWQDAKAYVEWLSTLTKRTYRLPSESEREYVARAGTTSAYWWGKEVDNKRAIYGRKSDPKGPETANSLDTNPWGLFHVHGNVWEWTEDCWSNTNNDNPGNGEPRLNGFCNLKTLRGGAWLADANSLRAAVRSRSISMRRTFTVGFRVARDIR